MSPTSPAPAPAVAPDPVPPAAGLLVLWLSVLAFVLGTIFFVWADNAYYAGVPARLIDPLDGMSAFLVVGAGVVLGLVPLLVALVCTVGRRTTNLHVASRISACWTAGWFVVGVVFLQVVGGSEASSAAQQRELEWQLAAGAVGLVPLAVAGVLGILGRR